MSNSTITAQYADLKDEIVRCIDSLAALERVHGCSCEHLREKVQTNSFHLVVVGQFKRGKTSLINALLGADILPVAVVPLTSIVTILQYGETLHLEVHFNDGRSLEIAHHELADYVTEKGNPKNVRDVSEVVISYPSPYLKDGVRLIDTPGVGSIYQHNTDVAYHYLPKSDAAIFLLSVDQPMSQAELDFLRDVQEYANRIFFLLNKADYLNEKDLQESIDFSRGVLKDVLGMDVRIYPVSARLAIEGKAFGADDLLQQSRLPEFTDTLNRFLMEEKGMILLVSVANSLLRALSQSHFELDLEMKSLITPLDELQEKIRVFEQKKLEVTTEKDDFLILLDGEAKKIVTTILEEDLTTFRRELYLSASEHFENNYKEYADLSLKELRQRLEDQIIAEVRDAYTVWRVREDEKLAKAFEASCQRFVVRIDETVDALIAFSAELFGIPFDIVKADATWSSKSVFYYKFREQPDGIEIVTSSLTLMLPKFIGEKIIIKKMKEYLSRVIDLQAARIGYDFEQKIEKSKLAFRWEMLQRIDATLEGIGSAIAQGMARRSTNEREVQERTESLMALKSRYSELEGRIKAVREHASDVRR
jgi:GTP-binding protein EngB required for normal cell division